MNINSGSTPLVLLCPAWKRWGTATTVKPGTVILHSQADDLVPLPDSAELVGNSGLPESALLVVGTEHRLADPESLGKMLEAVEAVERKSERKSNAANETFERGRAALANGDFDSAVMLLSEAIRLDPTNAAAFWRRGLRRRRKGRPRAGHCRLHGGHPARPGGRPRLLQPGSGLREEGRPGKGHRRLR